MQKIAIQETNLVIRPQHAKFTLSEGFCCFCNRSRCAAVWQRNRLGTAGLPETIMQLKGFGADPFSSRLALLPLSSPFFLAGRPAPLFFVFFFFCRTGLFPLLFCLGSPPMEESTCGGVGAGGGRPGGDGAGRGRSRCEGEARRRSRPLGRSRRSAEPRTGRRPEPGGGRSRGGEQARWRPESERSRPMEAGMDAAGSGACSRPRQGQSRRRAETGQIRGGGVVQQRRWLVSARGGGAGVGTERRRPEPVRGGGNPRAGH